MDNKKKNNGNHNFEDDQEKLFFIFNYIRSGQKSIISNDKNLIHKFLYKFKVIKNILQLFLISAIVFLFILLKFPNFLFILMDIFSITLISILLIYFQFKYKKTHISLINTINSVKTKILTILIVIFIFLLTIFGFNLLILIGASFIFSIWLCNDFVRVRIEKVKEKRKSLDYNNLKQNIIRFYLERSYKK